MDAPKGIEVKPTRGVRGRSKEWAITATTEEAGKWMESIGSEPEGYKGYRWEYAQGWARFRAEVAADESEPDDYTGLQDKIVRGARGGEGGIGAAAAGDGRSHGRAPPHLPGDPGDTGPHGDTRGQG
jgi:hypothetical protein